MALLLWDYDGVLVDTFDLDVKYLTAACQDMGIRQIKTREDIVRLTQGNFFAECEKAGIDLYQLEEATKLFEKKVKELVCSISVFPGMGEVMTSMAEHFPSYIVTSNSRTIVESMLDKQHITGIKGVLGREFAESKVEKILYLKGLFPGKDTYFIGDTSGDIIEAKAAGVEVTIGVSWGWHGAGILKQVEPDYLFHQVSELRQFLYTLTSD